MPSKLQSILLGGATMGIAAAVFGLFPTVGACLGCLAFIGAGLLAVWHYTTTYALTITGGTGASMGAGAGVVGAVASSIIQALMALVGLAPSWADIQGEMMRGMEEGGVPPEQMETWRQVLESPLSIVGFVLCGLLLYAVLGAVGGAIGASVFKKGGETPAAPDVPEA